MFQPSDNLSREINRNAMQSEIDGGVFLKDVPVGGKLYVQTRNTRYVIEKLGDADFLLSGSERFCPVPTKAVIAGSTWGGSVIKVGFIGRGMHMEFSTDLHANITTTAVREIADSPEALDAAMEARNVQN